MVSALSLACLEGASDLTGPEDVQPYLNFAIALMRGDEPTTKREAIRRWSLARFRVLRGWDSLVKCIGKAVG